MGMETEGALYYQGIEHFQSYMPPFKTNLTYYTENGTFVMDAVGMYNDGTVVNDTRVVTAFRDRGMWIVRSSATSLLECRPFLNHFYTGESERITYSYTTTGFYRVGGTVLYLDVYRNTTWNSVRYYDNGTGILVYMREYFGMSDINFTLANIPEKIREYSAEYALLDYPLPPWMPGHEMFNAERYDDVLWERYYSVKNRLPVFTRKIVGGSPHIVDTSGNLDFDTARSGIVHEIAQYLQDTFQSEDDRIIGAMCLMADPAFIFNPLWNLSNTGYKFAPPQSDIELFDVLYFHGPASSVIDVLEGYALHGSDAPSILRAGYGLCGAKSTVLAAILGDMGYSSGTMTMHINIEGVNFGHTVTVVRNGDNLLVFDPLFQQFYPDWNYTQWASYEELNSSAGIVEKWGFVLFEGMPYQHTLFTYYSNHTSCEISGIEETGQERTPEYSLTAIYVIIATAMAVLALLSAATYIMGRRKGSIGRRLIPMASASASGLALLALYTDVWFSAVYVTMAVVVLAAFALASISVILFTSALLSHIKG